MSHTTGSGLPTSQIMEFLRETPYFMDLSHDTLSFLTGFLEVQPFAAGARVLTEGEPNRKLYFLVAGTLGVYLRGERVATLRRAGDVLGEMSLISSRPCSATIITDKDSELLVFDVEKLKQKSPVTFEELQRSEYKLFAAVLVERLAETNEKARHFEIANNQLLAAQKELSDINAHLEEKVRQRTTELQDRNEKLEKADADNRSLVRILCHDLNNAISVIQLTADHALRDLEAQPASADPESTAHWRRVKRAVQKEVELVRHVRSMVALESGKLKPDLQRVRLHETLESASFLFQERLLGKSLTLKTELPDGLEVLADPVTLSHSVLNNLVSNAIKFSEPGGTILIQGKRLADGRTQLIVRDEGIGIPAELLPDLFSHDRKTSRPGTAGEIGTGFGMPLVKACMNAFGATIEVQSVVKESGRPSVPAGHGTAITLTFPAIRP